MSRFSFIYFTITVVKKIVYILGTYVMLLLLYRGSLNQGSTVIKGVKVNIMNFQQLFLFVQLTW